ncbi:MAG: FkbM family methyltransferase [Cyclobacteriaceae bacterium]|nr:FkbM family methyltransferase [Cyclobacteriaceae bacterium]
MNKFSSNILTYKIFQFFYRVSIWGLYGDEWDYTRNGELEVIKLLKNLPSQLIIFDVGANVGGYSLSLVNILREKNIRIYAFEPVYKTFLSCKKNLEKYSFIQVNNLGLGSSNSEAEINVSENNPGVSSIYLLDKFDYNRKESIKIITLDDFCERESIDLIHFLKIDVEGHEYAVLQGALKMLKANKIQMIQFEFGSGNINSRTFFIDFYNLLQPNFNLYRIAKNGLIPVQKYSHLHEVFGRVANYLAVSKSLNPIFKK